MSEICGYEVIVITLMLTKQEYGSVQVLNFFFGCILSPLNAFFASLFT